MAVLWLTLVLMMVMDSFINGGEAEKAHALTLPSVFGLTTPNSISNALAFHSLTIDIHLLQFYFNQAGLENPAAILLMNGHVSKDDVCPEGFIELGQRMPFIKQTEQTKNCQLF